MTKLANDAFPLLNELLPIFNNLVTLSTQGLSGMAKESGNAFKTLTDVAFVIRTITDFGVNLNKWLGDSQKALGDWGSIFKSVIDTIGQVLNPFGALLDRVVTSIKFITGQPINLQQYGYTPGGYGNPAFANIPRMAEGGIVMPSRGGSIVNVAEAGKPEAIIPLDRLGKMGGGATYNINVTAGVGDPAAIGQQIVTYIKKFERSGGPVFASA
jgi:ABC-type transporter Mla subunit MlaD